MKAAVEEFIFREKFEFQGATFFLLRAKTWVHYDRNLEVFVAKKKQDMVKNIILRNTFFGSK